MSEYGYYDHGDCKTVDFVEEVISCMDFDESKDAWHVGMALKYACRAGFKPGVDWRDDAKKCANYLNRFKNGEFFEEEERSDFEFSNVDSEVLDEIFDGIRDDLDALSVTKTDENRDKNDHVHALYVFGFGD